MNDLIKSLTNSEQTVLSSDSMDKSIENTVSASIKEIEGFRVGKMNDFLSYAKTLPDIRNFWNGLIYEGDIHVIFGDTNVGKSLLTVQMCDEITKKYKDVNLLYIDLEMSPKQIELRYKNESGNIRQFADNMYIAQVNDFEGTKAKDLINIVVRLIEEYNANFVVIDNLKAAFPDVEKSKIMREICWDLKNIRAKYGLTLIVLNHVVKTYTKGQELEFGTIAGSKNLSNFADEIIGMACSVKDDNVVYAKQLKTRTAKDGKKLTVSQYVFSKTMDGFNYLQYQGEAMEAQLLKSANEDDLEARIRDLKGQGKTQREIAEALNMSLSTVNRRLKTYGL